jgi:hypothetical protein
MAAAARDYLAVPRLFNEERDLLGIQRHSIKADTMRMLKFKKYSVDH